jgi:hypothetical protein
MVGNGVCDTVFDGNALVPFAHGMGLISDDMYKVIQSEDFISYPVSFDELIMHTYILFSISACLPVAVFFP